MPHTTLVSTDTVAEHLDDPDWVVVDCRHELGDVAAGERAHRTGHIPGARFLHLDRDLSGTATGSNGRHPLPGADAFAARLGALGIDRNRQVVVYDAQAGGIAARLWWMLRLWFDHEACALLDGGWPRWIAEGRPQTTTPPDVLPTRYPARPRGHTVVAVDDLLAHLRDDAMLLVDARATERFAGESETLDPVAGHIPGACNRPFRDNLASDGRFKPAAVLRAELDALLGGRAPESVVHQCGSGVSACHNMLAMAHAGLPAGRLYVGSWSEWCADRSRPVATGRI
jgi:thiosulfate/3-mercaptopyruvate sulfurtransferase